VNGKDARRAGGAEAMREEVTAVASNYFTGRTGSIPRPTVADPGTDKLRELLPRMEDWLEEFGGRDGLRSSLGVIKNRDRRPVDDWGELCRTWGEELAAAAEGLAEPTQGEAAD
jgi:hypothetical protein